MSSCGCNPMTDVQLGDEQRLSAAFKTAADGSPVDPTGITLTIQPPNGSADTVAIWPAGTIVKDSVGNFHYDFTPMIAGVWQFRWVASGSVVAQLGGSFNVLASNITA